MSEDFENGGSCPDTWSVVNKTGSADITFVTSSTYPAGFSDPSGGLYFARFNSYSCPSGDLARLKSPLFSTSGKQDITVSFKWTRNSRYISSDDFVTVQYSTDGSTWVDASGTCVFYRYNATDCWNDFSCTLPSGANNQSVLYISFLFTSRFGDDCHLDNVMVTGTSSCTPPSISSTTPDSRCGSGSVTLGAVATSGIINWYDVSTNGISLGTGTSFSPNITATTTYYVDATDVCTTASRTSVVATINASPNITGQPSNNTSCPGSGTPTFTVVASGSGLTYQWQEYISSWIDISNGGVYSGASTATLIITNPLIGMNGYKYRCVVSGICTPTATTDENAILAVTSNPSNPTANAGSGAQCDQFSSNWSAVSGATGYHLDVSSNSGFSSYITGYNNRDVSNVTTFSVSGLNISSTYYYRVRAYSACGTSGSSNTITMASSTDVITDFLWNYGFETGCTDASTNINCFSQEKTGNNYWTGNTTGNTDNRTPRTGSWNATLLYNGNAWLFRPLSLIGGVTYTVSIYARQNGTVTTDATIEIKSGNSATSGEMSNTIISSTGLTNGNYQLLSGNLTPSTTGIFYLGLHGWIAGGPMYISIDDLSITSNVTMYYSKSTGDLNTLATWGQNLDGSGSNPVNFTNNNQIFCIRNNSSPTINASWVVSGTASKVLTGDGVNACNFTIPAANSFIGTIDVLNNATLTIQNSVIPTLGTIATGSKVDYASANSQTVTALSYHHLSLSGSRSTNSITFPNGSTINVAGNLTNTASFSTGSMVTTNTTVNFNGTSSQNIDAFSFDNLSINNIYGVVLTGNVNVTGGANSLTMTNGTIILGNYNLTLTNTSGTINISSPTISKMIITNGTGEFKKNFTSGDVAAFTFPIGDNTGTRQYSPLTIDFSANSNSGYVGVRVVDLKHPNMTSAVCLSRYWKFSSSGLTNYTYDLTVNYETGSEDVEGCESDLMMTRWNASSWSDYSSTISSPTFVKTGLTQTSGPLNANDFSARSAAVPLAGAYHIGSGKTYTTLGAAITDLCSKGVSAACTFYLDDATYSESPIVINKVGGASATNTITFKPNASVSPTITITATANDQGGIKFYQSDYITFDGSNNSTSSRNITIQMAGNFQTYVFLLDGTITDSTKFNTMQNCCLIGYDNVILNIGVYARTYYNNLIIKNNIIKKEFKGILLCGHGHHNTIWKNIIGDATDRVTYVGINCDFENYLTIQDNEIKEMQGSTQPIGMEIRECQNTIIQRNQIHDITNTGSGTNSIGIKLQIDVANPKITVKNNFIWAINGEGHNSGDPITGIWLYGDVAQPTTTGIKIYNNSIYLSRNTTYGLNYTLDNPYVTGIHVGSFVTGIDMRNNIFSINLGEKTGSTCTSYGYGVYCLVATSPFAIIDYNVYDITNQDFNFVGYGNSASKNFADWKSWTSGSKKTTQEANSYNSTPTFTTTSDLHLSAECDRGISIAEVTDDFDGGPRSNSPDIGADERGSALPVQLMHFSAYCENGKIKFYWSTYSEINNAFFTLLQSSNSFDWESIADILGKGNANAISNYIFDILAGNFSMNYYKLMQTDFDGVETTLGIIAPVCETESSQIKIDNIIFNSQIKSLIFDVYTPIPVLLNYKIFDVLGRTHACGILNLVDLRNRANIHLPNVKIGFYFIQLMANNFTFSQKIYISD